jgi:hypothetical protein
MAQTCRRPAVCAFTSSVPRLARWLLMSQDRAHRDHFHVTHEFLATCWACAGWASRWLRVSLQRQGLISYHRGELKSCSDRSGLESAACSCYAIHRRLYAEQLG